MMQSALTKFITIEGIEGVGKSTALTFIHEFFKKNHLDCIVTREPGGTKLAEKIRSVLLTPEPEEKMQPETELLLMFAARAQHIATVIKPALEAGKWVISDRYVDASFAYQGGGRGLDLSRIEMLENWIVNTVQPSLTILLDASPEVGLARAKHRGPQDRIEQEKVEFFARVREGYLARAKKAYHRFRIIDASEPLEKVQAELEQVLTQLVSS